MKEKFEAILKEHGLYCEEADEILYAVNDMLLYVADKIKKEEPYATVAIDRLENAAYEVWNLASDL